MSRIRSALIAGLAFVLTAAAAPNNVVGHLTYVNGDPLANVTVTITTLQGAVVATSVSKPDGQIKYAFIPDGTYIATPTGTGCSSFEPASRTFTVSNNQPQIDFVGHCVVGGITLISPPNGAADIPVLPTFSWSAPGATDFEVYLELAKDPLVAPAAYAGNTTSEAFTPAVNLAGGTKYAWMVKATNSEGAWVNSEVWSFTTAASLIPPGYRFVPVTPCRVADTRTTEGKTGEFGPPLLTGGIARDFPMQGVCGIPPTAKAYSVNVTAVPARAALGYLTIWPAGNARPVASTLNSEDGNVVANAAILPAGLDGKVSLYATDDTDIVIDVNGYFDDQAGTASHWFYPTNPCRVADTRVPEMPAGYGPPAIADGGTLSFVIPGHPTCNLPAAPAYSFNVTVEPFGPLGYLTMWATEAPQPFVSTLNSYDGTVAANAAIVPASAVGSVSAFGTDPTHIILDANGYFGPAATGGMSFYPLVPCRIADTRDPDGTYGGPVMDSKTTRVFPVAPHSCGIPAGATALAVNVTVVPNGPLGYLTMWPTGIEQPFVSTLNSYKGLIVANAALVPVGPTGSISVYVTNPTHLVLDVVGYFAQ